MNAIFRVWSGVILTAACAGAAHAQTLAAPCQPVPKTRAEVRADLIRWEAAGFNPLDWVDYPDNAQQAARIVAQQRDAADDMPRCAP